MNSAPIHTLVETLAYTRQLTRLGVTRAERGLINDQYAGQPDYGALIRRTGGLRKGRVAREGGGKSGGYRVFSFFVDAQHPAYLLWIIDKTKDADLTSAQENSFRMLTAALKAECR